MERRAQKTSEKAEVYCLCRKPYDGVSPMIACDSCNEWFHLKCVKVSKKEAKTMETYTCPPCKGAPITKKRPTKKAKAEASDSSEGFETDFPVPPPKKAANNSKQPKPTIPTNPNGDDDTPSVPSAGEDAESPPEKK